MAARDRTNSPVIVVGGGTTGLVCATYLARAGRAPLVLEARDRLGGCCSTRRALGAQLDLCAHDHVAPGLSPVLDELGLHEHGLRFADPSPAMVGLAWQGGAPFVLFADPARTVEGLRATQRYEVDAYRRYLEAALPVVDLLVQAELELAPGAGRTRRRARERDAVSTLARWSRRSAADVMAALFESDVLRTPALALTVGAAGYSPGLAGSGAAAALYAAIHRGGIGRPVGGNGAVVAALQSAATEAGAVIRAGARVTQILADDDGVHGVRLADGEEIEAAAVVVACDPRAAVMEWLRPVPLGAASLVRRWETIGRAPTARARLDLVVDGEPERRADVAAALAALGVDASAATTTVVSPPLTSLASHHRLVGRGLVPRRPPLTITAPSIADPARRADDGGHVVAVEVHCAPFEVTGGWPRSEEPARWIGLAADAYGPDLRDRIVRWHATTPPDLAAAGLDPRRLAPLGTGAPVSGLPRRRADVHRVATVVDGLFIADGPRTGLGLFGAAGRRAAAVTLSMLGEGLVAA